jgi:FkbM family methyltransferase
MKTILRLIIYFLGYDISKRNYLKSPPRSSMQKSIEWLRANHFEVKTVLDVGASDGRWSKLCLKHFGDANYVLFEPQPCHSDALDAMEQEFKGKVTIIKKAAGEKSGKTYFNNSDPFGGSLADLKTTNTIEVLLTSIDDSIREIGTNGPFLLKLDTHGFEIPILEGAGKTLNCCTALIIEAYNYNIEPGSVTFWQLCEYLNRKGFRPIDVVDIMYREHDNSFWQMDIVFIKSTWKGFEYISYK